MVAGNDRWAVLRNVVEALHPRPPDDSQNWADQDPLEEPVEHVTSRDVCEPHRSWQPSRATPGICHGETRRAASLVRKIKDS